VFKKVFRLLQDETVHFSLKLRSLFLFQEDRSFFFERFDLEAIRVIVNYISPILLKTVGMNFQHKKDVLQYGAGALSNLLRRVKFIENDLISIIVIPVLENSIIFKKLITEIELISVKFLKLLFRDHFADIEMKCGSSSSQPKRLTCFDVIKGTILSKNHLFMKQLWYNFGIISSENVIIIKYLIFYII